MSQTDQIDEATCRAIEILTAFGLSARPIPRSNEEKRADILAHDDGSRYVIEVKHKIDGASPFDQHERELDNGEVISWATPTTFDNTVDRILKGARNQVDDTPEAGQAFRLLWFQADGIDHDARWQQAYSTFYGKVHLFSKNGTGDEVVECFYFDWTASHAMPSIDGLILSDERYVQLCLNEFSTQRDAFRRSSLCERFSDSSSVIDPLALEAAGSIIACRFDGSRKRESEVLQALEAQAGSRYGVIRFVQYAAAARITRVS